MKQEESDKLFMDIALRIAQQSHSRRSKVGAILVANNRILSIGFNGTPSGFDNDCEELIYVSKEDSEKLSLLPGSHFVTKPETIHAEINCIAKIAKSTESSDGSTMYCSYSPCVECAKLIIQSGIIRVVYMHEYRDANGKELLKKANILVDKV